MQVNRPLGHAGYGTELHLLHDAGCDGGIAAAYRNMQRIGFAPVTGRRVVTGKRQIAEQQTPHGAAIARQNANPPVRIKNSAAGYRDIFHIVPGFGANLQGAAVAAQQAVSDHNLPRRPPQRGGVMGGFDTDGIVGGAEIAVADKHRFAAVDIQRIGVGHRHGVVDGEVIDMHMAAAHQMDRPHRCLHQRKAGQRHLLTIFKHNQAWPVSVRQAIALRIPLSGKPGVTLTINAAGAAEGDIALAQRIEQHVVGFLRAAQRLHRLIVSQLLAGDQHRTRVEMQLNV